MFNNLRRNSWKGINNNKQRLSSCFYSLILVFIMTLGSVSIANAYVCFLPNDADCAQGDTEGFWPCVGSDCDGGENGKCDASYNSNKSTNDCGSVCTRCADSSSPYNGLYKCPENTCNCNEYTSTEAFNECGESCKVCRISGDKNYGKYKCPTVPAAGCPNPCKDCTLTEAQARAKMAADPCMECEQCANLNCTDAQKSKWRCSENKLCKQCRAEGYNKDKNSSEYIASQETCSRMLCEECPYNDIPDGVEWYKCGVCGSEYTQNYNNITDPQDKVNHCYENETCGCYMKCDSCFGKEFTMQDCQNAGYNSAKNECNGKRGTVYETCCNTCDGYRFPTDLSKTSEGWSCTECPNSCDGGSKYSCGCKEGYHDNGNGGCAKDCAVVTCSAVTIPSNAHGTTTCQSIKSDCSNNGSAVYTAWECDTGYHDNGNGSCVKDEPKMYWCIYPHDFTNYAFGGRTRNGGVYNIMLEGDGVKEGSNEGEGICQFGFYVPYGVSVSIKYTDDTVSPYSHRGWMFDSTVDCCDGFEPDIGYIKDSYFTADSFVATADGLDQDESSMTPGYAIDLSPVISKAEDRVTSTRWIQNCHGYYQLAHGKWQQEGHSESFITTSSWPLTREMHNTVNLTTTSSSIKQWNETWQEAVNYAKQTGYSGNSSGLPGGSDILFESELCSRLFGCEKNQNNGYENVNDCPAPSYLYGYINNDYCKISDASTCWGCYIGWHTQCVVWFEHVYDEKLGYTPADYVDCYDNNGKYVTEKEIMTAIGKSEEDYWYVTCDELGGKVIGHSLPDE